MTLAKRKQVLRANKLLSSLHRIIESLDLGIWDGDKARNEEYKQHVFAYLARDMLGEAMKERDAIEKAYQRYSEKEKERYSHLYQAIRKDPKAAQGLVYSELTGTTGQHAETAEATAEADIITAKAAETQTAREEGKETAYQTQAIRESPLVWTANEPPEGAVHSPLPHSGESEGEGAAKDRWIARNTQATGSADRAAIRQDDRGAAGRDIQALQGQAEAPDAQREDMADKGQLHRQSSRMDAEEGKEAQDQGIPDDSGEALIPILYDLSGMAEMIDASQAYGVLATNGKYARAVIRTIRIDADMKSIGSVLERIRQSGLLKHGTAWSRTSSTKGYHVELRLKDAVSAAKAIHIRRMLGDDPKRLDHDTYRSLSSDIEWAGGWFADAKNSRDGYVRAGEWEQVK